MADIKDDFEQIEAYLDEQLDDNGRAAFEARLAQEPTLRSATRQQQEAIIALRLIEKEQTRAQLKAQWADLDKESQTDKQKQIRSFVRPLMWAGAVAAVLTLLFLVFKPSPSPSNPQQLAMAYFDPKPPSLTKGTGDSNDLSEALAAYRAEDYAKAERLLSAILTTTPAENAQFYLALSQIAQQKWAQATSNLQPLANNSVFAEEVRWNRLLIALHEGQSEYAQSLIDHILAANRHYKQDETRELNDALQQMKP